MTDYPVSIVHETFSSAFVDEAVFVERLGGSKSDPNAIRRYLSLPLAARPELTPFFDRTFYWWRYPDMAAVDIDPLVHFMKWGVAETRTPHPLIDIKYIQATAPDLLPDPPTIEALHDVLSQDRADPSPLFSLDYYRRQLGDPVAVRGGLLRHFLEVGLLQGLKPNPHFDPIAHYRRADVKTHDIRSALRHFALSGETAPRPAPATAQRLAKAETEQLFRKRDPIRFDLAGPPAISVIMVVHDDFLLTLKALSALRANHPGPIELILIDSGSTDETRQLTQYVTGACCLRFETDIGFARGCNAGLEIASADTVLFLSNDVEPAAGAIATSRRRLLSHPSIAAVGAKIIRTDGLLAEAGRILWRDGSNTGYQQGQSPLTPEANFVRDVDFCSTAFLLGRRSALRAAAGFSTAITDVERRDADLCQRLRDAGNRVVYDPAVVVDRLTDQPADAPEPVAGSHAGTNARLFARSVDQPRGRVLFIEDRLPLRRLGSGYVRSNDIVGVMADLGYHVSVYPIHRNDQTLAAVYADFPDTAEIFHDRGEAGLEAFLQARRGYYDTIWIARNHNMDLIRPMLERCGADALAGVRIVLDTEAIVANRQALVHALCVPPEPFDLDQAVQQELLNAPFCQTTLAVNPIEAGQLRSLGLRDVRVLGHLRPLVLTPRGWAQRAGMLFVGAMHGADSPNYDSLCWFVDAVLPLIERQLGYETRLTIAGFTSGGADLGRFADHPRITLRGAVVDLAPLYNAHRVFVAPTRLAAGLPYKVHEAASYGVPVVATDLLRAQLGWEKGRDLLAADATDPELFAAHVVALYRDQALWAEIRAGAAERVRVECGRGAFGAVVEGVLG